MFDLLGFDKKKKLNWGGGERASKRLWNEFGEEESASGRETVCKMNENKKTFYFFLVVCIIILMGWYYYLMQWMLKYYKIRW